LSQVTGLPAAFIGKKPMPWGTYRYAEGVSIKGRSSVHIEDAVSSGGALVDTLSMLEADGLWPVGALCIIDRESGGKEALAAAGLELKSLFTYSQVTQESKDAFAQ
jgi:orotate phosphoribosyltransferase